MLGYGCNQLHTTLRYRFRFDKRDICKQLIADVREKVVGGVANHGFPFLQIVQNLAPHQTRDTRYWSSTTHFWAHGDYLWRHKKVTFFYAIANYDIRALKLKSILATVDCETSTKVTRKVVKDHVRMTTLLNSFVSKSCVNYCYQTRVYSDSSVSRSINTCENLGIIVPWSRHENTIGYCKMCNSNLDLTFGLTELLAFVN